MSCRRRWPALALVGLLAASAPASALASPFTGTGEADAERASRTVALDRAKRAALHAALEAIEGEVERSAAEAVLARHEVWTGAYRILEERNAGTWAQVKVEVEIDLARLRKRVLAVDAAAATGFRLGAIEAGKGCTKEDADAVVVPLRAAGVLRDGGGEAIRLEIRCDDLGRVALPRVLVASVEARVEGGSGARAVATRRGFGASEREARTVASERVGVELARQLAQRLEGGVTLRVRDASPASRVRRLEASLREAVVGVRDARLAGIEGDGTLRIAVAGGLDAAGLAQALATLEFPDFTVVDVRVSSADELTIRLD